LKPGMLGSSSWPARSSMSSVCSQAACVGYGPFLTVKLQRYS
jgi:hypothetical protein